MMTAVLFIIVYVAGLVAAFAKHPIFGLYTYMWAFYLSPPTVWWGRVLPDTRYLFIAAIVTAVAVVVSRRRMSDELERPVWYKTTPGTLVVIGVLWMGIQYYWAVRQQIHLGGLETFFKHGIVFALVYTILRDVKAIGNFSLVHVLGCFWLGYVGLTASGGRVEDLGGAINNANLLGVHASTGALFAAVYIVCFSDRRRWLCVLLIPFILNVIIITQSRGAILALLSGGVAAYFLVPKSKRGNYRVAGILGLVLFSTLASNSFLERMDSLSAAIFGTEVETASEDGQYDKEKRLDIAKGGWRIAMDHPLGVGYRGTSALSAQYMPEHVLGGASKQRGAHNTFIGVIAEFGIPGAVIFVLLVIYAARTLRYLKQLDKVDLPMEFVVCRASLGGALVAMFVGGQFSNYYQAEVHFWLFALLAALHHSAKNWEISHAEDKKSNTYCR